MEKKNKKHGHANIRSTIELQIKETHLQERFFLIMKVRKKIWKNLVFKSSETKECFLTKYMGLTLAIAPSMKYRTNMDWA